MKNIYLVLAILISVNRLSAQTNLPPVRLALISETTEAAVAVDILTAKLSGDETIQLLERDQIEKVYQEQSLSAANQDYLKLGRILGADGLLLLNIVRTPQATNLTARLIAVKPGVILADGAFDWPLKDMSQWSESAAAYLNSFLPKLTVLPENAIPLSVVNLRSAISSADALETERELKLLTIQRLSQERQLFVLERQKMQLLGEEKELKADDSTFWDGSYLLEGVVDQNGYSENKITINARLTPPKGGAPILLEASGSRTNLAEVINQLAIKVGDALKINSSVPAWNAADEAAKYFDDAKWALRWGAYGEAQAAAESAWALGKKDLAGARLRIETYLNDVPDVGPPDTEYFSDRPGFRYVHVNDPPDAKDCDNALYALKYYYDFSLNSPDGKPQVYFQRKGWNAQINSAWYQLGIEVVKAASQVLQHFNFSLESQNPVAEKLAELRALTRLVASSICQSPSVRDSYYVGERVATCDELAYTLGEEDRNNSSIFSCEVKWGCFWQESPEDGVALYRELMSSPAFCYIHNKFWRREPGMPRLAAWNEDARKRIPKVWNAFILELNDSTNVLWRMEGQALTVIDAKNDEQLESAFNNLMDGIISNRVELVENNVDLFYLDWRIRDLLFPPGESYEETPALSKLENECRTNYFPKLDGMEGEYHELADKKIRAAQFLPIFEKQKQYLRENAPYKFFEFVRLFQSPDYSKKQALEIQPFVATYKSNLVVESESAIGMRKSQLRGGIAQVGFLEKTIEQVINPPTLKAQLPAPTQIPKSVPPTNALVTAAVFTNTPGTVTNILVIDKFLKIPLDNLVQSSGLETISSSNVIITAHRYSEGKLLLDFDYSLFDKLYGGVDGAAIALLDPSTGHWDVIGYPKVEIESQSVFYYRSALWHGELFNSDGHQIRKYDFQNQQWQMLAISDGNNYELFVVNDRLYAANANAIFEIIDGGKSTRILASTRRQPPRTILDTHGLGVPLLTEGPNHSLRVDAAGEIFHWNGNDWQEDFTAPASSPLTPPEVFPDGILYRQPEDMRPPLSLAGVPTQSTATELYLCRKWQRPNVISTAPASAEPTPKSLFHMPNNWFFTGLSAALSQSNLFVLADHVPSQATGQTPYDSVLLCFSKPLTNPQQLFLKFKSPEGFPPLMGIDPTKPPGFPTRPNVWMMPTTNWILFGTEQSRDSVPAGNQPMDPAFKTGIWLLPVSQIEPAIAQQKSQQFAQQAQAAAAIETAQKNLIAKYDLNHNGVIDANEREAALDDPAFIASQLDVIDANHNGQLDLEELTYFDANQNKILEPKEQAGIEIALHLLAKRDLQIFDAYGDGFLNREELFKVLQTQNIQGFTPDSIFFTADENHDRKIDAKELESFLNLLLRRKLHPRGGRHSAFLMQQIQAGPNAPTATQQMFKLEVETYWRDPASVTNQAPVNHGYPAGAIFSPGSMPHNGTP